MIALNERQFKATLLSTVIVSSWAILWAWSQTHYGQHSHQPVASILPVLFFAAGWTLMTVAMMLPTTFPLLGLFHAMIADRKYAASLVGSLYHRLSDRMGFFPHPRLFRHGVAATPCKQLDFSGCIVGCRRCLISSLPLKHYY